MHLVCSALSMACSSRSQSAFSCQHNSTPHLVGSSGDCCAEARSASLNVNSKSTKSASGGTICKAQGDMYEEVVPGNARFRNLHQQKSKRILIVALSWNTELCKRNGTDSISAYHGTVASQKVSVQQLPSVLLVNNSGTQGSKEAMIPMPWIWECGLDPLKETRYICIL